MNEFSLISAFLVGLFGGVHCVGMCGGIVGVLSMGIGTGQRSFKRVFAYQLAYNLGRISSYALAGAIMGGVGVMLAQFMPVAVAQKVLLGLAGVFMLLLGLYLAGWWNLLAKVEQAGGFLWRRIQPLGNAWLPVKSPRQALLLGLLWGWIPCGLVYSVLIWSVSSGSIINGAMLMLAFGLGTLPNLLAMGLVAEKLRQFVQQPRVRQVAGLLVMLLGLYTLAQLF